jgi:hypothetical protein
LDSTTRATPKAQTALTRERERKRDSGEIFYKRPKTFPDKMLNEKKKRRRERGLDAVEGAESSSSLS